MPDDWSDFGSGTITPENPWSKYASIPMIGGLHDGKTFGEMYEPGGYTLRGATMVMTGGEYRLHGEMLGPKEYRWVPQPPSVPSPLKQEDLVGRYPLAGDALIFFPDSPRYDGGDDAGT